MSLVGKGEHFLIATTVSERFDFISCTVEIECWGSLSIIDGTGQGFADAMNFLLAIAVVGLEIAGYFTVGYFYLGAENFHIS